MSLATLLRYDFGMFCMLLLLCFTMTCFELAGAFRLAEPLCHARGTSLIFCFVKLLSCDSLRVRAKSIEVLAKAVTSATRHV